jgi:putative hydrolase of the HAD superfamily
MIKVVLFDTDGVLVNGEMFSVHLERDYGISTATTKKFFEGPFKKCLIGESDIKEILPPYLKEWGWNGDVEGFLMYWFRSEHDIDSQLIKTVSELRSKGIKCYIATNQEKYRTEYLLKKMGFEKEFDGIFSSSHIGHKKPSSEFFTKMLEELGNTKPQEILFWDDKEENILAAKEFGLKAEKYNSFEEFSKKIKGYLYT